MRVRHPSQDAGGVDVDGRRAVIEDGVFEIADDEAGWLRRWCDANGYDPDAVVVSAGEADATADEADDATHESDGTDEAAESGVCGYFDEASMEQPCQRDAGWGRDADTGPCKTHAGADA